MDSVTSATAGSPADPPPASRTGSSPDPATTAPSRPPGETGGAASGEVGGAPSGVGGAGRARLGGLDGIRGLAALFVVLHHCWLLSFPGFPADTGPGWAGWLLYGHFAVVVFITLSGFSLAVSPARAGWRLGGVRRFARRRAWRILPPYWAALAFSLAVAWLLVPQPGQPVPTGRTVVVYGLLLQDVFGSPSPNGALWSIAVEAQLYFVFPLLLLLVRRLGAWAMAGAVTVVVAAVGVLAASVPAVATLMRLTPQFAVLFAAGVLAAGVLRGRPRAFLHWAAAGAAVPVLVLIVVRGSVWTVANFFWVDLALAPAAGLLLAAVACGRPRPLVRLLDTRPVRALGSFSYSLYLVHAPIVVALNHFLVAPLLGPGVARLLVLLAVAVPASVVFARGFAAVCELPFQRHRSAAALRVAVRERLAAVRPKTG
ncbi:acyltransferase [Actinomadura sp. ATCC 31491]|uniref:Acyltransferase n=1 Tax=Actinomadura luzonensis TaxID=2805427 RepID=A0ABT0FQU9_9ACTN|nr:acyltransferase [Actinomadura luzonensis]MCK2214718.1 acyltransferase [Actinomadura luzonensis]